MFKAESILVPVDFSEHSDHALDYALGLAKRLGATVSLVHVYPVEVYAAPPIGAPVSVNFREHAQKSLDELVARIEKRDDVSLGGQLCEGVAHREICRVAKESGADVIVMGTHGRTGLEKLLLGSVAERVVRSAEIPVVTVPLSAG